MATVTGKRGVTIPQMLFHEGEGLTLTIETRDGTIYRGMADITDDSMNVSLSKVLVVDGPAPARALDKVFLRGSQIMFVVFPDILARSPMFDRVREALKGKAIARGLGKGRQQAIMAKGECRA